MVGVKTVKSRNGNHGQGGGPGRGLWRDDGERAPPERRRWWCSMTASAEQCRGQVTKSRSEANLVTGTVGGGWTAERRESETRRWRAGTAAGEDIMAGVMIRPPVSCVKQSATSGTMPAPGDGGGAE